MNKITLGLSLLIFLFVTTLNADVNKGQRYFTKKLKNVCELTGAEFSELHTQDQWKEIHDKENGLAAEIKRICPSVKDRALKEKYIQHYFDFFYEYGNDSGNIPAC